MKEFLETAKTAAVKAGALIKDSYGKNFQIERKGDIDLVTEVDKASEKLLKEYIISRHHDHTIITEESADRDTGSVHRWIIDPLDATTNFTHGFPVVCVSVALQVKNEVMAGAVYNPFFDYLFYAARRFGAYKNNRKISVSQTSLLNDSLLATGFPYDIRDDPHNNLDHFSNFAVKCQGIRRCGAAALDLCFVACGWFDGFWEVKLKPWDMAAGALIVQEAGGIVSDLKGRVFSPFKPQIVANNGLIHQEMLNILKSGKTFMT